MLCEDMIKSANRDVGRIGSAAHIRVEAGEESLGREGAGGRGAPHSIPSLYDGQVPQIAFAVRILHRRGRIAAGYAT